MNATKSNVVDRERIERVERFVLMKIDWDKLQKHWDWLGHIIEALVMSVIVAVFLMVVFPAKTAALLGLAFSAGHFHGREKRDYETSVKMRPPHLKGHLMWRWTWDQATDFWPTALVVAVVSLLINFLL